MRIGQVTIEEQGTFVGMMHYLNNVSHSDKTKEQLEMNIYLDSNLDLNNKLMKNQLKVGYEEFRCQTMVENNICFVVVFKSVSS